MTALGDLDAPPAPERPRSLIRAAVERLHPDLTDVGTEPDPRFTFANERTFLAWARTGLALIGGGLLAAQVLHFGLGGGHLVLALPTIGLGGLLGIVGFRRWQANERAMRLGEPLGQAPLVPLLMVGIIAIAVISAALVMIAALLQ